ATPAEVVVRVVNDRGTPLAGAVVQAGSRTAVTDWRGEARLAGRAGALAFVTRGVAACGGAPAGATVTLRHVGEPAAVAVVPAITPASAEPAGNADEAKLVALVNQERARRRAARDPWAHAPVGPVRAVRSLNRAADTQAAYVEGGFPSTWRSGHCGYGRYGPALRAQDAGFSDPRGGLGEVMAYASTGLSAEAAFRMWMNSPGHRGVLMSGDMTVIGAALFRGTGVMVVAAGCGSGAPATCETRAAAPTGSPKAAPPPTTPRASTETPAVESAATQAERQCVVPAVRGKTLSAARHALGRAGCAPGRTLRVRGSLAAGRVLGSRPGPGTRGAAGSPVELVLSRRPLRRAAARRHR
ncbi:MAG: CAP domain-containing protein, partial [Gaiellaceae bacterium]